MVGNAMKIVVGARSVAALLLWCAAGVGLTGCGGSSSGGNGAPPSHDAGHDGSVRDAGGKSDAAVSKPGPVAMSVPTPDDDAGPASMHVPARDAGMDAGCTAGPCLPAGNTCTKASACASGFCVDGVCCRSACGGDKGDDCQACSAKLTGGDDGTCAPLPTGTVCRASAGPCDFAEVCDGASAACPGDVLLPAGIVCRAAVDVCDATETCSGTDASCPADTARSAGTVCREPAGPCDLEDTCDGSSPSCANQFRPTTFVCNAAVTDVCDAPDHCSGASAECPAAYIAGPVCRPAVGPCDLPELCSGTMAPCPNDQVLPAGVVCKRLSTTSMCDGTATACP